MSTRCQVRVRQEGIWEDGGITLYHHCDGYPTGILPLLAEAFRRFGAGYEAGRAGKVASFLCAIDPGAFEPEEGHQLHGDIEYYYRLYCVNSSRGSLAEKPTWEVEVFSVEFDKGTPEEPGKLILPRTEVLAAEKKADEIEAA